MFNMLIFLFAKSSNINEVIRAVLNFFFFLRKDFVRTKSTKKHQKAQKAPKNTRKTQKRNQAKAQNANKQTKIKKHLSGKK